MKVKQLKIKHPEYDAGLIAKYNLLYEGGAEFLKNVVLFLPKRHSEAAKLYYERQARAFYIGYVGPIIDYFCSNLFVYNPNIEQKSDTKNKFYTEFLDDVDLKRSDINCFFKEQFTETLKHKVSYILIDFPKRPEDLPALNRKEEEELGLSRAYLVPFSKAALIDWQYDEFGNFEWVKFQVEDRYKPSFDSDENVERYRWYIYTKDTYEIYEFFEEKGKTEENELSQANLVDSGNHSTPGTVPVLSMSVPNGLWVMNKIASIQTELFNLDNALAWQEYQGHYAMPVVKLTDNKSFNQRMGESYYIKLGVEENFEWAEPEGRMMEVGLKRREMLKDELFRVIHQMSLSIKQTKTQTRQSGTSKQEDRYATETILRAFGDVVRTSMQRLLTLVSTARKDNVVWDVSGFSLFDNDSISEKLAQKLQLKALNIHSETFNKEIEKRTVNLMLEDANEDVKKKIEDEIESFDFSNIINDPLMASFGGYGMSKPQGITKPSQQPEKPNNTNSV